MITREFRLTSQKQIELAMQLGRLPSPFRFKGAPITEKWRVVEVISWAPGLGRAHVGLVTHLAKTDEVGQTPPFRNPLPPCSCGNDMRPDQVCCDDCWAENCRIIELSKVGVLGRIVGGRPLAANWLRLIACAGIFLAVGFSAGRASAYDLERCEWLGNQAFQLAYMREAGTTLGQVQSMVRNSDMREETKVGVKALAKYVYAHRGEEPGPLAARLEDECRSYDE